MPLALPANAAQSDPPWRAHWAGARAHTRLDQTFTADAAGRKALADAFTSLALYVRLALECEVRPLSWSLKIDQHFTEVIEDPGIHLNYSGTFAEEQAIFRNIKNHAGDSFADSSPQEKQAVCLLVPGAPEIHEADEIARRPLLRHHDQWEGAGGD